MARLYKQQHTINHPAARVTSFRLWRRAKKNTTFANNGTTATHRMK